MPKTIKLPDGKLMSGVPDDASDEAIRSAITSYAKDNNIDLNKVYGLEPDKRQDATFTGEAARAVGRGLTSSGALIVEGLPAVFRAGMEELTGDKTWGGEEQTKKLVDALNKINNDPDLKAAVGSYEDIQSPHDAALYLANAAQMVPDLIGSLGTGFVVKTALKKGITNTAEKAAVKALESGATREAAKKAAEAAARKSTVAAYTAGAAGYNQAVMTPAEQAGIYAETGEVAPGLALGSAAIQNVGETASDLAMGGMGPLAGEVAGRGIKSMAKAFGKGAVTEGATEGAQGLVSEAAQEIANPEKATFDGVGVLDQTILGSFGGGTVKGLMQPLVGGTEQVTKDKTPFTPPEEVITPPQKANEQVSPAEQPDTSNIPLNEPETPPNEAPGVGSSDAAREELAMDEVPTPPIEAYGDVKPVGRPKSKVSAIAEEIRQEKSKQDPLPDLIQQTQSPEIQAKRIANEVMGIKNEPLFNVTTNIGNKKIVDYVSAALNHVGWDEDIVLLDNSNLDDDSWVPTNIANQWLNPDMDEKGSYKDQAKKLTAKGFSLTGKDDNGKPVHYIGINPTKIKSEADVIGVLAHEMGHVIANRFVNGNTELKTQLTDGWRKKMGDLGVTTTGITNDDIAKNISSWSFNQLGDFVPEMRGTAKNTTPELVENGNQSQKKPGDLVDVGYYTSFNEYMAENIAKWYQSNEEAVSVLDKFFKAIADLYRNFLDKAKKEGMMPDKQVDDFMNNLVLKARGENVARGYTINPGGGLQELRAYHGTPHRFQQFSLDKVGSGEGYQAFGWGLYFTSSKAIAKFYKDKLSSRNTGYAVLENKKGELFNYEDIKDYAKINNWVSEGDSLEWSYVRRAFQGMQMWGTEGAIDNINTFGTPNSQENEKLISYVQLLDKSGFSRVEPKKGALYEVNIPEENKYLHWDDPVSGEILKKLPGDLLRMQRLSTTQPAYSHSGQSLYESLIDSEGSDKAASEYLNSLGIKGIKYRAGTMSGIDNSNSTNYVVFDDAAIQINKVFDDDSLFNEMRAQEENVQADSEQVLDKASPFTGYRPNPKVENILKTPYNGLNSRVNAILKGFTSNIGKNTLGARQNSAQQYLVLNDALTTDGLDATYLPEVFRGYLKNTIAVPDKIRNVLDNDVYLKHIVEGLRNYYKITKPNMKTFGVMDVKAEAYKLYTMRNRLKDSNSDEYKKLDTFVTSLPENVTKSFQFIDALKTQIKSDLNTKAGILNPKDLVQGLANDTVPSLESLFDETKSIRNLSKKETLENRGLGEAFASDPVLEFGDKKNTIGGGIIGRNALVARYIARFNRAFARVKVAADERREAITGFRHLLFEGARNYFALSGDQKQYLGDLFDMQRNLGEKAAINPETGFLEFKRRNKDTGDIESVILKDKKLSETYKQMQDVFTLVPMLHRNQLTRSFAPLFAKANLGFTPTKEQYQAYKEAVAKGNVSKENRLSPSQMNEMDKYFETMDGIDKMLARDYVPHLRFGTRGAVIKDKAGKTVWFSAYKVEPNGKTDKDSYQEFKDDLQKFKDNNPEYADANPSEYELTIDNISKQLGANNKAMTLELLSQLLNSSNPKLFIEANKELVGKITPEDLVAGKIANRGFMHHFAEAEKETIQGYSTDWPRVMSAYFNSAAYFLGNLENESKLLVANSKLQNESNASQYIKDYSDKYVKSILNPQDNYSGLRELQYVYAMGLNPSSALLQLQSLFTTMPSVLTMATNSIFQATANLTKATLTVPYFLNTDFKSSNKLQESMFAFGDAQRHEDLIKKGKITRVQSDIIKSLYNKGTLQALRSGDMIGVPSDVSTRGNKGKWAQRRNNASAGAGVMMRVMEEATRGIQALASIYSLESPDNMLRLHNNLLKNDEVYKVKMAEGFTGNPDVNYLTQFLIDKALGEYGKESRSPIQNTGASVTAIPFSSFPTQMLTNILLEQIGGKYGKDGVKAGLWALATTAIVGGATAVPAGMFIKEMIELIIQQVLGEDRDLEEEFKKYADGRAPDWITRVATNGVFSELFGVDASSRMSLDVPLGTELLKAAQGEQKMDLAAMLGVQGNIAQAPVKAAQMALQGETLPAILAATVPNVAVQNVIKAVKNKDGASSRGMPTLTPEQGSEPANFAKRFLGFKPMVQGDAEAVINETKRDETRYNIALDRFRKPIKATFKKELLAKTEKEREEAANKRFELARELSQYMQSKKLRNINSSINKLMEQGYFEALQQLQGIDGLAVRKNMRGHTREAFDSFLNAHD